MRKKSKALIDVPQSDQHRATVDLVKLEKRWLEELQAVYPLVFQHFKGDFRHAFAEAGVQTKAGVQMSKDLASPAGTTTRSGLAAGPKRSRDDEALEDALALVAVGAGLAHPTKRARSDPAPIAPDPYDFGLDQDPAQRQRRSSRLVGKGKSAAHR